MEAILSLVPTLPVSSTGSVGSRNSINPCRVDKQSASTIVDGWVWVIMVDALALIHPTLLVWSDLYQEISLDMDSCLRRNDVSLVAMLPRVKHGGALMAGGQR